MQTVLNHDSDVDILHKYNFIELKGWVNQLQYIDNEVDKLLHLYAKSISNNEVPKSILALFSKRKKANRQLLDTILAYGTTYKKVSECDDIQCDMMYLRKYEQLRKSFLYHIEKYQKLKNTLYDKTFQKI